VKKIFNILTLILIFFNPALAGDAEAFMLMTKDLISISNGSACTSSNYEPSHVIKSMTNNEDKLRGALRFSWCHLTDNKIPVEEIEKKLKNIL